MTSSLGYELRRLADLDDSGTAAVTTPSDSQTSRRRAVLSNIRNTMSGTPASNAKPNKAEHREAGAKAEGGGAREGPWASEFMSGPRKASMLSRVRALTTVMGRSGVLEASRGPPPPSVEIWGVRGVLESDRGHTPSAFKAEGRAAAAAHSSPTEHQPST